VKREIALIVRYDTLIIVVSVVILNHLTWWWVEESVNNREGSFEFEKGSNRHTDKFEACQTFKFKKFKTGVIVRVKWVTHYIATQLAATTCSLVALSS
jgi:hypothetical protein